MRKLYRFHGGIHPEQHKTQSTSLPIATAALPARLTLPLSQHTGARAEPIVQVGEGVLKGQKIAAATSKVSAAIHAPTSGKVVALEARPIAQPGGGTQACIVIDADGEERWTQRTALDYRNLPHTEVIERLREFGVVGLGGAVFPSHIKLDGAGRLRTVVVNGSECEPYITCDDMLMRERAEQIVAGLDAIHFLTGAGEVLVGIEDNKPQAIAAMRAAALGRSWCEIVPIPTIYPGGGEKQLIRTLTGIEVPAGRYPYEFGVACFNVGTVYALHRTLHHGEPLIGRIVTVTGNVAQPRNFETLLGTPIAALLQAAEEKNNSDGYLMGGPMMGIRLLSKDVPVVKATNCVIATSARQFPRAAREMPCIRCGQCAQHCPADLQPFELYWHARARDFDRAADYGLRDCIECGVCDYVCPSKIPLVHYFRHAKGEHSNAQREQQAAVAARQRFDAHNERLARAALDGEQAAAATAPVQPAATESGDPKQVAVAAALARARARRNAEE